MIDAVRVAESIARVLHRELEVTKVNRAFSAVALIQSVCIDENFFRRDELRNAIARSFERAALLKIGRRLAAPRPRG